MPGAMSNVVVGSRISGECPFNSAISSFDDVVIGVAVAVDIIAHGDCVGSQLGFHQSSHGNAVGAFNERGNFGGIVGIAHPRFLNFHAIDHLSIPPFRIGKFGTDFFNRAQFDGDWWQAVCWLPPKPKAAWAATGLHTEWAEIFYAYKAS